MEVDADALVEAAKPCVSRRDAWTGHAWMLLRLATIGVVAYGAAAFAFGEPMLPGGRGWALLLIWLAAFLGGHAIRLLKLPSLLGMLLSGVVLVNLPGNLVAALPDSWSAALRAGALAVILMRSGLELDVSMLKSAGSTALRLTACPGIAEALVVAGVAVWVFGMPIALGLTLGFILAAVSPAVVVSGMFDLQLRGYGVSKGIPSIVVAAASFDDVLAITGYSLCIGLAVPSGHSLAMDIAHGPINVVAGVTAGAAAGAVLGCTRLWPTRRTRTLAALALSQLLMFCAFSLHYTGAGAMASLVMAIVGTKLWAAERAPRWYSAAPSAEYAHETEHDVAVFWTNVAQPVLFGVIGTAVDFSVLSPAVIPRALAVIACGVAVRLPMAAAVTWGAGLNTRERLFIGGSWLAKATVQAALASAPLDLIVAQKAGDPEFARWARWGQDIITTAVLSILVTAPLGLLFITYFGDKWLTRDAVRISATKSTLDLGGALAGDVEGSEQGVRLDAKLEEDRMRSRTASAASAGTGGADVFRIPSVPGHELHGADRSESAPAAAPSVRTTFRKHSSGRIPSAAVGLQLATGGAEGMQAGGIAVPISRTSTAGLGPFLDGDDAGAMSANLRSMLDCIDEEAELLLQSTAEDSIVHRRARQIALSLQRFQQQAVAASLRQSVMGIEEGNGTAGNFFRIARRTHLARAATLDSSAVPPAPEPLRNASSLRS